MIKAAANVKKATNTNGDDDTLTINMGDVIYNNDGDATNGADATYYNAITGFTRYLPAYRPLHAKRDLARLGWIDSEALRNERVVKKLGEAFAATLKGAGITEIVFNRNGYVYHGVIKSFAEALRANEIKF